jgi:hypothetical protein
MHENNVRGRLVPFLFRGDPGARYFCRSNGNVHLCINIRTTEEIKAAKIYIEMCQLILADPKVAGVFASFPPYGTLALQAKVHAALDMVLETMNEGKVQTILSPKLIKKRMRAYLQNE